MAKPAFWMALSAVLAGPAETIAQPSCTSDAIIVFDGSASMAETSQGSDDASKIVLAREAMHRSLPEIALFRRLGLVTYGPGADPETCNNASLLFPPVADAAPLITGAVNGLEPDGNTPLTDAVRTAADALGYTERPGVVVLVTDGRETCGGSPCALGAELADKGAALTVHVIGFQLQQDHKGHPLFRPDNSIHSADCLAEKTGGLVVSTETVDELVKALNDTLACPVVSFRPSAPSRG